MRYHEIIIESVSRAEYLTRRLVRTFNEIPQEINNGWCWGFANRLARILGPEAKVVSTTGTDAFPGHSVVEYRGKYYDAESPQGVSSLKDLAYSKRMYSFINDPRIEDSYDSLLFGKTV